MIELDRSIFLFLNSLHTPFLDEIMRGISLRVVWLPLYLFIIYLLFLKYRNRVWIPIFFGILLVVITDQVTVLIKNFVERPRPCHEPLLQGLVHTVNGKCGGMFGFVSSHAGNTFGLASFSSLLIQKRWYSWSIYTWASVVSYSRIYLGVHYPGDILGGAIVGIIAGLSLALIVKYINKRFA